MKNFILITLLLLGTYSLSYSTEKPHIAKMGNDNIQIVNIEGGKYFFKPNHIILKKGFPVIMTVIKQSSIVPHNIIMNYPDAGMQFDIDFHEQGRSIAFTPTKIGTYKFYCDKKLLFFDSHQEKGMHGTIQVIE